MNYSLSELLLLALFLGLSGPVTLAQIGEECLLSDLFSIFDTPSTFLEAINVCGSLGGTLARISNEEEFNHVLQLITNTNPPGFWIGKVF